MEYVICLPPKHFPNAEVCVSDHCCDNVNPYLVDEQVWFIMKFMSKCKIRS